MTCIKRIILIGISFCIYSISYAQQDTVYLNFGDRIDDLNIIRFVTRNDVRPIAAYMWSSGFSGTFRVSEEMSIEEFLEKARSDNTEFFENALIGNLKRIKDFITEYSEYDIEQDERLFVRAQSIVSMNRQFKRALEDIKSSDAVIYGIEVESSIPGVSLLLANNAVKSYVDIQNGIHGELDRPANLENYVIDDLAANSSTSELYEELVFLANE